MQTKTSDFSTKELQSLNLFIMSSLHLIEGLEEIFSACRDDSNNDFDQTDKRSYDETGDVNCKRKLLSWATKFLAALLMSYELFRSLSTSNGNTDVLARNTNLWIQLIFFFLYNTLWYNLFHDNHDFSFWLPVCFHSYVCQGQATWAAEFADQLCSLDNVFLYCNLLKKMLVHIFDEESFYFYFI